MRCDYFEIFSQTHPAIKKMGDVLLLIEKVGGVTPTPFSSRQREWCSERHNFSLSFSLLSTLVH